MQIAETRTTDDFPEGAILIREDMPDGKEPRLTKVTDRTGTAILWERNETEDAGEVVGAGEVGDAVQPEYPKVACEICGFIAGNKGALTGHLRAKHPAIAVEDTKAEGPWREVKDPRFLDAVFGKKERALPKPAIQALENLLSNATFQSVRKVGDRPMEDFFYGFASGMQAALAIVCGTLGYNTDFLNEKNTDMDT